MSLLRAENLVFGYAKKKVFDGFSCGFSQPGLTLVLGPNGSGKSTLLRLMAGICNPQEGDIRLNDDSVFSLHARQRAKRIAWMPQTPSQVLSWPVSDYILSGRFPFRGALSPMTGEDRQVVANVMKRLHVDHLASRVLNTLSGGEQQLVRVARALAQEPDVLLLDEPFGPLDIRHRVDLWEVIRSQDRMTIMVSHDISFINNDCQSVVLLKDGRLIAQGKPGNVLNAETIAETFQWTPPKGWKFQPFQFR